MDSAIHTSVLLREVLDGLNPRTGGYYVDATLGLGGHAEAILEASSPDGRLLGVDRDRHALELARQRLSRFGARVTLVEASFSELPRFLERPADGLVADLGVSSLQFDTADRGFSFRSTAPLDMRMGDSGPTAAELLADVEQRELAEILGEYGDVPRPFRVARVILEARDEGHLETTTDLARAVEGVIRSRPGIHPATRVFQAIRIWVNRELDELEALLLLLPDLVAPGGRAAIISFHSLEDRMVKWSFRGAEAQPPWPAEPTPTPFVVLTKKPTTPTPEEVQTNPRARSAKLRIAERRSE